MSKHSNYGGAILIAILVVIAISGAVSAAQQPPTQKLIIATEQYQLTNGQTATVFLLEREGMLCTAISIPGGLDCEPLQNTTYGRQIGKP